MTLQARLADFPTHSPGDIARVMDNLRCMTDALDAPRLVKWGVLIGGIRTRRPCLTLGGSSQAPKNLEVADPSSISMKLDQTEVLLSLGLLQPRPVSA